MKLGSWRHLGHGWRQWRRSAALLAGIALTAQAPAGDDWRVSGFATFGAVTTGDSEANLFRSGISASGSDRVDFAVDSIVGLQVNRQFEHGTDVTAQVIAREDQAGSVEPRLAWAFARFTPMSNLQVRLGRMRAPFFMYSDSVWINYANIWVRPPLEVYGLNPFTDLDGADLIWRLDIGEADIEVRPYVGRSLLLLPNRKAKLSRVYGLNLTTHFSDWSLFVGHAESPFALPWGDEIFTTVDAALRRSPFASVADELSGRDGYARFDAIGMQWDGSNYLFSAEYARRAANRYIPSAHGWHITLARRFGNIAPYFMLARQIEDEAVTDADLSAIPPLQAGLDLFLESRNTAQKSATLGVRWDFHRKAALKVELTHAHMDRGAWGSFTPAPDKLVSLSERRINVLGVSVDLSF